MSQRRRLLVTRRLPEAVHDHLRARFDVQLNDSDIPVSTEELRSAMTTCDAVLLSIGQRLAGEIIETPGATVKIIANFGAGVDHIDLEAAKRAGIVITNTPDAVTEATADLALMLMLMAARRGGEAERLVRRGEWKGWGPTQMLGQSLQEKVLGLVGFGRIGQAVARRARAFGMSLRYHTRRPADEQTERELRAAHEPDLDSLVAEADVLSLHIPGGEGTHHLMNRERLGRLRPEAILINTARGSVVDEAALVEVLEQRKIFAAGLDVFEREPEVHPGLLALDNVVLIPHLGSATIEARTAMGLQAAANIEAFFEGREPPNRIA